MSDRLDPDCICHGNWRAIVNKTQHLIGRRFRTSRGETFRFFGIVHGDDDYYYGMCNKENGVHLLSCVVSFEMAGYELVDEATVFREGVDALFDATPEELGQAAVEGAKRNKP